MLYQKGVHLSDALMIGFVIIPAMVASLSNAHVLGYFNKCICVIEVNHVYIPFDNFAKYALVLRSTSGP